MVLPAGLESKESGVQIQESAASDLSASESTLSLCRSHDVFTLNHTQCLFIIIKKTLLWWLPYVDWDAFSSNQRAWRIAARALCKTLMSTEGKRKKKKQTDFKTLSPPLRVLLQWNYFNHFWSEHSFTSGVPNLWPPGQNWPTWEFNTAELINVESQRLRKHCMLVMFCQIFHYIYI